jgi:hypothetical protein
MTTEYTSLREELLSSYQSELHYLLQIQDEGVQRITAAVWDFTGKLNPGSYMPIERVISEVEDRILILANPECSEEEAELLNY